ncbi:hypothetical protein [Sulfurimonas sp. HSL-1716]|uniref:hypothetical protein n=1 Tax=Hydrocurvibacter sulfurireducens TaxID=3131937 RepID=UPI0031F7ADFD
MNVLPEYATKIDVPGATVDFYTYTRNDVTYYQFDTSLCEPPFPMVNAMRGIELINATDHKLVMINHKKPIGLFEKIKQNYDIFTEDLEDGRVKITFSYKAS